MTSHPPSAWAREADERLKRSRERRDQTRRQHRWYAYGLLIAVVCAIIAICVMLILNWPGWTA